MREVILSPVEQQTLERVVSWIQQRGGYAREDEIRMHLNVYKGDMDRFYRADDSPIVKHVTNQGTKMVVLVEGKIT